MVKLTRERAFDVLGVEVGRSLPPCCTLPQQHGEHLCVAAV